MSGSSSSSSSGLSIDYSEAQISPTSKRRPRPRRLSEAPGAFGDEYRALRWAPEPPTQPQRDNMQVGEEGHQRPPQSTMRSSASDHVRDRWGGCAGTDQQHLGWYSFRETWHLHPPDGVPHLKPEARVVFAEAVGRATSWPLSGGRRVRQEGGDQADLQEGRCAASVGAGGTSAAPQAPILGRCSLEPDGLCGAVLGMADGARDASAARGAEEAATATPADVASRRAAPAASGARSGDARVVESQRSQSGTNNSKCV